GEEELVVLLEQPGDFVLWGAGIGHRWRALQPSVLMTLRWSVLAGDGDDGEGCRAPSLPSTEPPEQI
ncbi:MAG: hypothetical protein ACKO45_09295, partial [Cyanobium sp.]